MENLTKNTRMDSQFYAPDDPDSLKNKSSHRHDSCPMNTCPTP